MRPRARVTASLFGLQRAAALALCLVLVGACATIERIPYTQQEQELAVIPGIPEARVWADDPALARKNPLLDFRSRESPAILALSGGGADGAFGAGLLNGWSQR